MEMSPSSLVLKQIQWLASIITGEYAIIYTHSVVVHKWQAKTN